MRSFAQYLSSFMGERDRISADLEISKSTLKRWAAGESNPHPVIRKAVWSYLNDLELQRSGLTQANLTYRQEVGNIVREMDLQGLIKLGAPEDEYNSEADKIAKLSFLCRTVEEMTQGIWAVFATSFSPKMAGAMDEYKVMAERIFELKEKFEA